MHEPSSVGNLAVDGYELEPDEWGEFVDAVCAQAKGVDPSVLCTASLIPGPEAPPGYPVWGEARFQVAALKSDADLLGVNNIHYYNIHAQTIGFTDDFIDHFKNGMTDPETQEFVPGRGEGAVFLNALWRPPWAQILNEDYEIEHYPSNGAGVGCTDYDDVDEAYLTAMFNYARAHGLVSINPFYTCAFVHKQDCPKTTQAYMWVLDPENESEHIPGYQQGNVLFDVIYRRALESTLEAGPDIELTDTGNMYKSLADQFSGGGK